MTGQYILKKKGGRILTGLSNEQKEPHTSREIQQQRSRILRVSQQVSHGKEGAVELALEPRGLDGRGVEDWVRGRAVGASGATNKGRGEAPSQADEDEAENVVEDGGVVLGHGG